MNEEKFTEKAKTYASSRPSYPDELIDLLYRDYISSSSVIADFGSGTGIFSKLLLERGNTVFCVEPNIDMLKEAENSLSSYEGFRPVFANAENSSLPDNSVDFITAAQSFHWFDRKKFAAECKRICKEQCIVALIWNAYDASADKIKELEKINAECCPAFKGFAGGSKPEDGVEGFFDNYKTIRFSSVIYYDLNSFINRCLSSSYSPFPDSNEGKTYIEKITAFFKKHAADDRIALPFTTVCHIGEVK